MNTEMPEADALKTIDDTIVYSCPTVLNLEQTERLKKHLELAFPGTKVMIVDGGAHLGKLGQQEQLDRIEAKLDALLDALAEEDEGPGFDLEGNELPTIEGEEAL